MIDTRIQPLVPFLVLPDQSGFVTARSTTHNLRIFSTLHYFEPDFQAVAVLLDAAKAFDSLQWAFVPGHVTNVLSTILLAVALRAV